jgi:hypothetical protein
VKPCLPYHVAFQIHVEYSKYTIKRAVVDEGTATCMMSLVYWKALSSQTLSKLLNMLTAFEGHFFHPHGILPTFLVQLGGNMVEVEVEVVVVPLDYNLLLGHNCTYAMVTIVSFVFHMLCFLHQGKIMTVDQLSFAYSSPNASIRASIPVIDNSHPTIENIVVRMYSSLMGNFNFSTSNHHIYTMYRKPSLTERSIPFRTSYFSDPWTLPSPNSLCEGQSYAGMAMPQSTTEIVYQVVIDSSADPDPVTSPMDEEDLVLRHVWATSLSCLNDCLDDTFPSEESILEAMNGFDRPWDDMHH